MGDCQNRGLRVQFDRRLKLRSLGSKVTTDAGLLVYRELDGALRLTGRNLVDSNMTPVHSHGYKPT
jgi:hypothetical protein